MSFASASTATILPRHCVALCEFTPPASRRSPRHSQILQPYLPFVVEQFACYFPVFGSSELPPSAFASHF